MPVLSYNKPPADTALIACPDCDLLQRLPELAPGASTRCLRCDLELGRRPVDSRNRTLALTVAAAILWIAANSVPMLGLSVIGHQASTTVFGGALHLWNNQQQIVAVLILFTALVAPAMQIGFLLAVELGSARTPVPAWVGALLRHHPTLCEWSMIEVMLIGVLVALIKIAELATVIPGLALFMLAGLVFLLAGTQSTFDRRAIWEQVTWAQEAGQ
jgi:paraquat-inducible protein A